MSTEETVVFAPMAVFCCILLVLITGFIALVLYLVKKGKESSWQGKVVDKKVTSSVDMDTNVEHDYYHLVVETNEGKPKKVGVGKKLYDDFSVGDRIRKDKGELRPKRG